MCVPARETQLLLVAGEVQAASKISESDQPCLQVTAGGVYTVASGVTEISKNAFRDCTSLKSVSMPSVTYLKTVRALARLVHCTRLAPELGG